MDHARLMAALNILPPTKKQVMYLTVMKYETHCQDIKADAGALSAHV